MLVTRTFKLPPEVALEPTYKAAFVKAAVDDNGAAPMDVLEKFVKDTVDQWSQEHRSIKLNPTLISGGYIVGTMSTNGVESLRKICID